MVRESPSHNDCMEVVLEDVSVAIEGYPLVEGITGFAVSLAGEARLDFVGYEDALGRRVELSLHETDPFRRAARAALWNEAVRVDAETLFEDGFFAHAAHRRTRDFHHIEGYR
jgi:hypothetical protein